MLPAKSAYLSDDLLWRHLQELPYFRALLRAVEARFYEDIDLPEPVLDVGCGDGHFAAMALADRAALVGIDPWWPPLRESARRKVYRAAIQASGAALPFPSGHFATAISNSVLEHIPDLDPVLAEINRVLRPGGRFIFCVPSDNFLPFLSISRGLRRVGLRGLGSLYERFFNRISRHYHCDDPATWAERLARAGLALERHWYYFSRDALRTLEWGHYFGAPAVVAKKLTGRWVISPSRWNLWLTDRFIRRYYEEALPTEGAYLFFVARK
ncbi:MAG TPA: methyltransferase domain-containing protein [Anaerolineae bacterium]|nr:methyltransferase domain-containing protein [Anaerolineae bacterium]